MSQQEATALGYQPTPGNQLKNHSEEIATARPKPGHTESLCIDAGEVLLCDMVKVLVLDSKHSEHNSVSESTSFN